MGRLVMLAKDPSLGAAGRERLAQILAAAERIREIVVDMHQLTRVHLFEHTTRGLPEMIDIRKSAGGPGAPRSEPPGGSGAPGVAD
jgi:hypothetical protein